MGEATTGAGVRSFGVSYGLYNLAWGVGLLGGPALGGFLFERLGFAWLLLAWAPMLLLVRWRLGRVDSPFRSAEAARSSPILEREALAERDRMRQP
jgi:MFS family permease